MFSKAVKKDQQVILVVSLFPIIPFIIVRLVGSPGVEEVLSIVEELTDLTTPLVVDLTELDGQPTNVLQGHLLPLLLLPLRQRVLLMLPDPSPVVPGVPGVPAATFTSNPGTHDEAADLALVRLSMDPFYRNGSP